MSETGALLEQEATTNSAVNRVVVSWRIFFSLRLQV
jgi:hypothetical protein